MAALVSQLDFIFFVCVVLLGENRVESVLFCDVKKESFKVDLKSGKNGFYLWILCISRMIVNSFICCCSSNRYCFDNCLLVCVFRFREKIGNLTRLWHSFIDLFCNIKVTKIRLNFLCSCLNYFRLYSYSVLFPFSFNINRVDVGIHTNLYLCILL